MTTGRMVAGVAAAALWCALVACTDSTGVHETPDGGSTTNPTSDGGRTPEGGGEGSGDCYTHPQNHVELLNACTDSQPFDKTPNLPLLLSDGGLPLLP